MEWCEENTLWEYILEDKCANQRAELCVIAMLSLLYGCVAAQERRINMHRDIKPQNILLTFNIQGGLQFKLADFGLCTTRQLANHNVGTNLYKAP